MTNNLSPIVKNYTIVFWEGQPLYVTETTAKNIQLTKPETFTVGGATYNYKSIKFIGTIEKYKQQFPQKDNYNPINRPLHTFEEVADAFAWTHYPNMLELITKTHRNLRAWKGSFKDFCKKHNALTGDDKITTMKITSDKGHVAHVPFAYPFFCAIRKLIEERDEKREYAEAQNDAESLSWDDIEKLGQNPTLPF